jgi:hypothetical protein
MSRRNTNACTYLTKTGKSGPRDTGMVEMWGKWGIHGNKNSSALPGKPLTSCQLAQGNHKSKNREKYRKVDLEVQIEWFSSLTTHSILVTVCG